MKVQLDMYQTLAIAVLVLLLGSYLRKKIKFLERFCIPAPVVGGLLFAIFTCICYVTHILEFSFDDTLKEVCMVFFFTSVGFQANLKVLKKGGKSMVIFLGLVIVLIFIQNGVAVGLSKVIGLDSLIGMCTGSIPMVGGHGTAGAFGPVLEDFNVKGATTICTAAATFGLIFGSLVGGPLGKRLIEKKNLLDTAIPEDDSLLIEDEKKHERHSRMYASAVFQLIIAIGIGTIFSWALTKTGLTFPIYIGAMIAAALMRNIAEYAGNGKLVIHMGEINDLGGISLSLFLGMAMITLKLWQLASLALPLVILLGAQIIVIVLLLCGGALLFIYYPDLFESADRIEKLEKPVNAVKPVPVVAIPQDTIIEKDTVGEVVSPPTVKDEPVVVPEPKKEVEVVKKEDKSVTKPVPFNPDSVNYIITGTKATYTIKEGETLTRVALRFYGTKALWPYIVKYNPDIIKNPNHVPYGTTIKIPELVKK